VYKGRFRVSRWKVLLYRSPDGAYLGPWAMKGSSTAKGGTLHIVEGRRHPQ
jgi:hypothetical protein